MRGGFGSSGEPFRDLHLGRLAPKTFTCFDLLTADQ